MPWTWPTTLGYADRNLLRDGLAMTLAKTPEEEGIFLQCFDRFFSQELADFSLDEPEPDEGADNAGDPADPATARGDAAEGEQPGDAASPLAMLPPKTARTCRPCCESPLMQALMENDRNELSLAISQAAEGAGLSQIQMFTQKGQFTRRMLDAMGEEQIRRGDNRARKTAESGPA